MRQVTSWRGHEIFTDLLFADLVSTNLVSASGHHSLASHLVRACSQALPVTGAGLSLTSSTGALDALVAGSDDIALTMENLQFGLGEGPSLDAARSRHPVLIADLAYETRDTHDAHRPGGRWPMFTTEALLRGVGAVFAYPLQIDGTCVGVLGLYRDRSNTGGKGVPDKGMSDWGVSDGGVWDKAAHAEALHYAAAATALLLHLQDQLSSVDASIELADDRAAVHQATGMVSISAGVAVAEALLLLRARAYTEGRGVGDLAEDIVAGRTRLDGNS